MSRSPYYYNYIVPKGLSVPLVTSVLPVKGPDTGGTPLAITGSGFVPGAQVFVNGVLAGAIVVVGPLLITCTTPISALDGPASIVVINPDLQSSGGSGFGLFTYYGFPDTLLWTGIWKADYSGSPWVGSISAGLSLNRNLTPFTIAPPPGAAQNAKIPADFPGIAPTALTNFLLAADQFIGAAALTVLLIVQPRNPGPPDASAFNENAFCGIGNSNFGVTYSTSGVRAFLFDGIAYRETPYVALTANDYHQIAVTFDGATLSISVDGGAAATVAAFGGIPGLGGTAWFVGRNGLGNYADFNDLETRTMDSVIGAPDLVNYRTLYVNPTYGLSL